MLTVQNRWFLGAKSHVFTRQVYSWSRNYVCYERNYIC